MEFVKGVTRSITVENIKSGGPSEIRTLGGITLAGFQDRCYRPTQPKTHKKITGGATQI